MILGLALAMAAALRLAVSQRLGVSFTGAGLCTPFHLGAAQLLAETGRITDKTALAGSSGGALAATMTAVQLEADLALSGCAAVAAECAARGTRGTLRMALEQVLRESIPAQAVDLLNSREAPCTVAYAEVSPRFRSHFVESFASKDDLIEVLSASCNIPFYFNGNRLTVPVRGALAVDGFFAMNFSRVGAPSTSCLTEVVVCPFRPSLVRLNPTPRRLSRGDVGEEETLQTVEIVSPALLDATDFLFTNLETIQLALAPPSKTLMETLDARLSSGGVDSTDRLKGKVKSIRGYEGKRGAELVYTYLFNAGVLAAYKWHSMTKAS